MRFGSVCSGIEAASQAWGVLGWEASFFSEIEKFPCAVLAHHYPHVPNHGDMTKFQEWPDHAIDLLVGGTPCQSFSVAGLRAGLADPRGNLMLTYLAIAARYQPRWLVWENVPGVLSSNDGRDFGTFLGALGELGYGFAYRVLDAQFCRALGYDRAVPQRRRRVFVVGYLGDWRRAAAVLFDGASLRGDPAPSRRQGKDVAPTISSRPTGGGGLGTDFDLDGGLIASTDVSRTIMAKHTRLDPDLESYAIAPAVAASLTRGGSEKSDAGRRQEDDANLVAVPSGITIHGTDGTVSVASFTDVAGALRARVPGSQENSSTTAVMDAAWAVRRLTPLECCRLQGFPDDYFDSVLYRGKKPADGPIYKALGNSMAVNCMRVLGTRIHMVEEMANG